MIHSKLFVIFIIIFSSGSICPAADDANQPDMEKSVTMIRCAKQDYDYLLPWQQQSMVQGIGSGFVIEGNRILTNAHNVSNYKYIELKKENLPKRYPARVAFVGHDCDLALIEVKDETFFEGMVPLKLGDIPKLNSTVTTHGFPMGGQRISVTEGVVSRIQMDLYSHSGADSHLVVQTDAAINPGNSGGPVMQDGHVVGVAFQGLTQADNIGYMIPTTVIRHFLDDVEDGRYDGFASLGINYFKGLHSESYKAYLNVPEDKEGVVVISTLLNSSAEDIFEKNDVLTMIDGYEIDNDGMIRMYGLTIDFAEVIEQKQIGETIDVTYYRNGEQQTSIATVQLNRPVIEYARQYDVAPRYICFAGLVFTPITRNYLETWGGNWLGSLPHQLRYLFLNSMQLNEDPNRKEYVVLAEIMPDAINAYCGGYKSQVIERVNNVPILSLDDLAAALEDPPGEFHLFQFRGNDAILPINAEQAATRQQAILEKYQIPQSMRLEKSL